VQVTQNWMVGDFGSISHGGGLMTWRHLEGNLNRRFTQVRAAIQQRRDQLVTEAEMALLERQCKRVQQLNDGLRTIADQANRRVVALLDEYSDIAFGGQWRGKRRAAFEVPFIGKPPSITQQRRERVTEIDALIRGALTRLQQSYDGLLADPDAAEAFEKQDLNAIVDRLMADERKEARCSESPPRPSGQYHPARSPVPRQHPRQGSSTMGMGDGVVDLGTPA
jgi:hypothetical protein